MIIDNTIFDIGILGAGMGGATAAYKVAKDYPDAKAVVFDLGRPFGKRRRQLEGWLGCLPNSDGKFYLDVSESKELCDSKTVDKNLKFVKNLLNNVNDCKEVIDNGPNKTLSSSLNKAGYDIHSCNYIQTIPKEIHLLSKLMVKEFDDSNLKFVFDNEVLSVEKNNGIFHVFTQYHMFKCKKLIMSVGRSGWRWANQIYNHFGLVKENNVAKFGLKIETPECNFPKGFNKSHCYLTKNYSTLKNLNSVKIGRFHWGGQVVPEDHYDLTITGFRSNEDRWASDNVCFDIMGYLNYEGEGFEQTDRVGKLSFILANDRAIKERFNSLFAKKSKISIMKEYDWFVPAVKDLLEIIPGIAEGSYIHLPTLEPHTAKINISKKLETDLEGMYCIGESANVGGLTNAAVTGSMVVDFALGSV